MSEPTRGAESTERAIQPQSRGLTLRAAIVGIACVVLVSFVTLWAEQVIKRITIGVLTFPPVAFGVFVFLILANRLVRWWRPRWALRPPELLVVYVMMLLSAWTSSRGAPARLIPLLTSINYYADPSNKWQSIFFNYIPHQLVPWDTGGDPRQPAILALYEGLHYGEPIPWSVWIAPLAHWFVVVLLMFAAFICLATLLRSQWADNERLSFPLAQLPIEMLRAETGEPFYRNRLLYLGAAIPVVVHLVNLAHNINPDLPQITLVWNLRTLLFTSPPLNQITSFYAYLPMAAIGFFFLLPSELLFSFWFFYLVLGKGHEVVLLTLGQTLDQPSHADTSLYLASAEAGGFFVLSVYLLYLAKPIFSAASEGIRRWRSRTSEQAGAHEMMPYSFALVGLIATIIAAAIWLTTTGLSLPLALMEVIIYVLVIALVMTRATAEGGLLMTEIIFTPLDIYGMFGQRRLLGAGNLTAEVFATVPFAGDMRGLTLQGMMDTQKIADSIGMRLKSLHATLWVGIIASLISGFAILLWVNYRQGAMAGSGQFSWLSGVFFEEHAAFLSGEERFNPMTSVCFFLGAAFTIFLAAMRRQFWWWPLHPLGFVMVGSWSLVVYWLAIFIAWLIKTLIVHYGGLSGYTKARPFFLGLIFGEMTIAVVLTLVDAIWHIPAPYIPFD
jgi:hypothetical protein